MAFTISDLEDLKRLLAEHPEWRAELRPLILGDDLVRLPDIVRRLAEAQERTERAVADLAAAVNKLVTRADRVDGAYTEWVIDRKAVSYFGTILSRTRPVTADDLGLWDAVEAGRLTRDELVQITSLDLMLRGRDQTVADGPETVLAVEISATVDYGDVDRASQRAKLLERLGLRSRPVVAGYAITEGAQRFADERGAVVKIVPPSELPR